MSAEKVSIPATAPAPVSQSAPAKVSPVQPLTPGGHTGRGVTPDGRSTFTGRVDIGAREPAAPAAPTEPAQPSERPDWLPEKFKTPEDLAQAYRQLEQRMGAAEPAPKVEPAQPPPPPGDLTQRMTQEFASTGAVGAALRAEFRNSYPGLPESYIDNQIAYMRAQNQRASEMATRRLGSPEAVQELMTWAGSRLSHEERQAFNRAAHSEDPHMVQLAIDGLAAKYEHENGRPPRIIAGRRPQAELGNTPPFQSNEEWATARKDPRYKTDSAYRQLVADRLAMSQRMGLL